MSVVLWNLQGKILERLEVKKMRNNMYVCISSSMCHLLVISVYYFDDESISLCLCAFYTRCRACISGDSKLFTVATGTGEIAVNLL